MSNKPHVPGILRPLASDQKHYVTRKPAPQDSKTPFKLGFYYDTVARK